ncbi:MAG: TetR/AcrR family transcriptional regulator [Methyloligellaceae bacterium]
MPRKSDAKEKLIKTAARLFRQRGYHAVGLTEILDESGAPKGSFYHHFPEGKDELAEHCLRYSSGRLVNSIDEAFENARSFNDGVQAMTKAIGYWFKESNYELGCPIATVILETTPQSERIQQTAQEIYKGWVSVIKKHAARLGETSFENNNDKAEAVILAFEGAWVLSRIQRSVKPFELAARLCTGYDNTES